MQSKNGDLDLLTTICMFCEVSLDGLNTIEN